MNHVPIPSNRYMAVEDWPSTTRGPVYTRPMFAEFKGQFQHTPMFVFPDGRALGVDPAPVAEESFVTKYKTPLIVGGIAILAIIAWKVTKK
jgi:hypothetical protein